MIILTEDSTGNHKNKSMHFRQNSEPLPLSTPILLVYRICQVLTQGFFADASQLQISLSFSSFS